MTAWIVISFNRLTGMRPEIQWIKHWTSFFFVWRGLHFRVHNFICHHGHLSPVVLSQINLCIIAGFGRAYLNRGYCLEPLYGCITDVSRLLLNNYCWFFTKIVALWELFCVVMLLMSPSNQNNNEGNGKVKQAAGLTSKTKTLNKQHTFWQFFAIIANISNLIRMAMRSSL